MNNYGEVIKEFRKMKNMSQKQLGDMLGVSQQRISKWETRLYEVPKDVVEKINNIISDFKINNDDNANKIYVVDTFDENFLNDIYKNNVHLSKKQIQLDDDLSTKKLNCMMNYLKQHYNVGPIKSIHTLTIDNTLTEINITF